MASAATARNITIVFTPEEKEAIRRLAFEARMPPSSFLRQILFEQTDLPKQIGSFFGNGAAQSTHIATEVSAEAGS